MNFILPHLQQISPNYFYAASNLTQLLLPFNKLQPSSLPAGCFNFSGSGDDLYLDLGWNQLTQGVDISAFGGLKRLLSTVLHLPYICYGND